MTTFIRKYKVTMELSPIIDQVEIPVDVAKDNDCEEQKCGVCFWEHSEEARQKFIDNIDIDDCIESANIVVVADVDGELKDEHGEGLIDNPREIRLEIQKENREYRQLKKGENYD